MFAAGFLHGFWPGLTVLDGWRSVIAAPFVILGFGSCLAAMGLRPLYLMEDGALRLGASTHPAFLAGFTLTSIDALLLEQVRGARAYRLALLAGDILILLATGARAPLLLAGGIILVVTGLLPAPGWPWASRIPVLLAGFAAPALVILAAHWLGFLRLLTLTEQGGRDQPQQPQPDLAGL